MGLPTAGWQAGIWVAIALGARPLARLVWPRVRARVAAQVDMIVDLAPWIHSILPAYLAVITGAVTGRDLGLYGQSAAGWTVGVMGVGLGMGAAAAAIRMKHLSMDAVSPQGACLDELRWALFRAAGIGWTGGFWPGVVVGLLLACGGLAADHHPWESMGWRKPGIWAGMMRAGLSAVLFAATQNLWLILVCQVGLAAMLRRRA